MDNIILHIPHASLYLPSDFWRDITVDKENIYLLHACRKQKNKTEKRDKDLVRKRASELGKQLGKKFI